MSGRQTDTLDENSSGMTGCVERHRLSGLAD